MADRLDRADRSLDPHTIDPEWARDVILGLVQDHNPDAAGRCVRCLSIDGRWHTWPCRAALALARDAAAIEVRYGLSARATPMPPGLNAPHRAVGGSQCAR